MNLSELSNNELTAFIKAMHEARFALVWNDPVVWASPFVAKFHADLLDEQCQRIGRGNPSYNAKMMKWLNWSGRSEHETVLKHIRSSLRMSRLILSNPEIMREILHPFVVDDASMADFVRVAAETVELESKDRPDD
jgi:hypothetical protein